MSRVMGGEVHHGTDTIRAARTACRNSPRQGRTSASPILPHPACRIGPSSD
ncbi:hypothetical protein [Streptomyces muensis]|uniref:Uncharacterized protein n=1 Tax=Streptomyces muensis TaxID=1077944 RepID=A0A9X1TNC1_STRM4|nr:hypothetical protein [Streptomyces muensis]MCF1596574.1 hypothetical protein [Streptomyces muensis]